MAEAKKVALEKVSSSLSAPIRNNVTDFFTGI